MDWTRLYTSTLIPQIPKILNDNFTAFKNYINVFYNETTGVIIKPINTTGRVKGSTGEFVNVITDNMTVKTQFTNLYSNITTADIDWVTAFNGTDVSIRVWNGDACTNDIWPKEPSAYSWVDATVPYIKIINDVSYGIQNGTLGQMVEIIPDASYIGTDDFAVLLEASTGTKGILFPHDAGVDALNMPLILICTAYDASWGPTWTIRSGDASISVYTT